MRTHWWRCLLFRKTLKTCQNLDRNLTSVSLCLQITECSSQRIQGLSSLRSSLATMSIHRSTETMMVKLRLNIIVHIFMKYIVSCILMCAWWCLRRPPVDPGTGGERVLTVGARGGGVWLSRHRRYPCVEKPDHAGHEPQLHQHHRQLSGEAHTPTITLTQTTFTQSWVKKVFKSQHRCLFFSSKRKYLQTLVSLSIPHIISDVICQKNCFFWIIHICFDFCLCLVQQYNKESKCLEWEESYEPSNPQISTHHLSR